MERVGPLSHTDLKDDFLFFIEQVIGQMLSIQVADVLPYEDATFWQLTNGSTVPGM